MKKYTVVIILILLILKTQAQDYMINFVGEGDTTAIDTIKVDNLSSGASVIMYGGDTLHLMGGVGINSPDMNNGILQLYPNPMTVYSTLTITAPDNGIARIFIVDLSGRIVCRTSILLSTGTHSFRISGICRGIYFVKVSGLNYNYSAKLISQSDLQSEAKIDYVSTVKNTNSNSLKNSASRINMPYKSGDQLIYTAISGVFCTIYPEVPDNSHIVSIKFNTCKDDDNHHYAIVHIGGQTWMARNLNVGVRKGGWLNQSNNGIIEKYCYSDTEGNCSMYGGLYQWNEMMQYSTTEGTQGICPGGWHLPTDAEWSGLISYLAGQSVAGGKMKETGATHWVAPNTGASNSSGFTALPGGLRDNLSGIFDFKTTRAYFWSSSQNYSTSSWFRQIGYNTAAVDRLDYMKAFGFSVRCVRN